MNKPRELLLQPLNSGKQVQPRDGNKPPVHQTKDAGAATLHQKPHRRRHSEKDMMFTNPDTLKMFKDQWRKEHPEAYAQMEDSKLTSMKNHQGHSETNPAKQPPPPAANSSKPRRRRHSEKDTMFTNPHDLHAFQEQWRKEHPKQ